MNKKNKEKISSKIILAWKPFVIEKNNVPQESVESSYRESGHYSPPCLMIPRQHLDQLGVFSTAGIGGT